MKEPKRVQLDKELYMSVYNNAFLRKTCDWALIIEKAQSFYDDKKISDNCTFSEGSKKSPEELTSA